MAARQPHKLKCDGSSPSSATIYTAELSSCNFCTRAVRIWAAFVLGENMIIKICTKCGKTFRFNGKSLCNTCYGLLHKQERKQSDKVYNQKYRNKQSDRFYHSAEWKRLSRFVLRNADYRCAVCGGLATEVHHIEEITVAWDKRFDIDNLMPLCVSCHNRQRQGSGVVTKV